MSSEEVVIVSQGLGQIAAKHAQSWFNDLHNGSGKVLAKHMATLITCVVVGKAMPLSILAGVAAVFVFSVPLVYTKQPRFRRFVDEQAEAFDSMFDVFNYFDTKAQIKHDRRARKVVQGGSSVHGRGTSSRKSKSSSQRVSSRMSQALNPMFGGHA
jgi:hypothetical protein